MKKKPVVKVASELKSREYRIEKTLNDEAERVRESIKEKHRVSGDVRVIFIPKVTIYSKAEIEGTSLYTD